jgi:hypothetical protein
MSSDAIFCPYCESAAELVSGESVYPGRHDLGERLFYACLPCKAWVGVNAVTGLPHGSLANAELRQARQLAHSLFDPLWRRKAAKEGISEKKARGMAYSWLAAQMDIDKKLAHIGYFNAEQCAQCIEICKPYSGNGNGRKSGTEGNYRGHDAQAVGRR